MKKSAGAFLYGLDHCGLDTGLARRCCGEGDDALRLGESVLGGVGNDKIIGFSVDLPGDPAGKILQSFRLEGVTALSPANILRFADAAAVQAGTAYGTLASA